LGTLVRNAPRDNQKQSTNQLNPPPEPGRKQPGTASNGTRLKVQYKCPIQYRPRTGNKKLNADYDVLNATFARKSKQNSPPRPKNAVVHHR
jgi:hypothetical protein